MTRLQSKAQTARTCCVDTGCRRSSSPAAAASKAQAQAAKRELPTREP